nr:protealysin inhibitor emfourin [Specibacter cremeus]
MDTDDLAPALAAEVLGALEGLAGAVQSLPSGAATQPRYRLAVSRPAGPQIVELTEAQIPHGLRPLIEELRRRAHPA